MILITVKVAVAIALGVLAGCTSIYIFNTMPAKWLCDYDEAPSQQLLDPHIQRVKGYPWRWIYSAGFSCLLVKLAFFDVQFAAAALFACWALLMIGLADLKYMIIPDQFVIMLALSGFGFVPFHESLWSPILGVLLGGGTLALTALIGGAAFRKEVMGFGDVKLMASLGLILGVKGIAVVLIGSSICSGAAAAIGLATGKYKKDEAKPLGPYICGWAALYVFILFPIMP